MFYGLICSFVLVCGIIKLYNTFFMMCLLWSISVRSRLRHFHSNQVPDAPLARDYLGVYIETNCRWLDHNSIRRVDGLLISFSVSCMKLLLDVKRFFRIVWSCSGYLVWHSLYLCAATIPLIVG